MLATAAGGVWFFFTVVNLLMVALRFFRRKRASSVPLVGTAFGIVALIAVPVSLPWWSVLVVLIGFLVIEFVVSLWPASLIDAPSGPEQRT